MELSDMQDGKNPIAEGKVRLWLPVFAWAPFAVAVNSFLLPQGALAYWGRWLGLLILLSYGFLGVFVSDKWIIRGFDKVAIWVFGLILLSTLLISGNTVLLITNSKVTAIVKACSLLVAYLSLTWGLESLLTSLRAVDFIVKTFVLSAAAIFTLGILGNLAGVLPTIAGAWGGIFVNPNTTAALGIVLFPLAIWFASQQSGWFRLYPVFVILAALLLSQARTPLVVLILLVIYYLLCWPSYKRVQLTSLIGPICLIGLGLLTFLSIDFWDSALARDISDFVQSGFATPRQPGYSSYRLNLLWPMFVQDIFASPLTTLIGHGWGSEEALTFLEGQRSQYFSGLNLLSAHSSYIGLTYQIGIIGAVSVFLPLWGLVFAQVFKQRLHHQKDGVIHLKVALVGAVLAGLGMGFFESGLYSVGAVYMLPFWIAAYLATRIDELATVSA